MHISELKIENIAFVNGGYFTISLHKAIGPYFINPTIYNKTEMVIGEPTLAYCVIHRAGYLPVADHDGHRVILIVF